MPFGNTPKREDAVLENCRKWLVGLKAFCGAVVIGVIVVFELQFLWAHRNADGHIAGSAVYFGNVECRSLFGWITREDRRAEGCHDFEMVRAGDILYTSATHSLGWRHGHAALVIDKDTVLECGIIGSYSELVQMDGWKTYADCTVLRVKEADKETGEAVAGYAYEHLQGVPYHLSAGFIGKKAPKRDAAYFGAQCAYIVWYAWERFGYNLDGDGGRLVTPGDILLSEQVEIVCEYKNPAALQENSRNAL